MRKIEKPQQGEFAPYASAYIDLLPDDGSVLKYLEENLDTIKSVVNTIPQDRLAIPCAEGEWTVKEILVHLIDAERIISYRALRFARSDMTELPGFDQDPYVVESGANQRSLEDIFAEYTAVRSATIALFNSLSDDAFTRIGIANKNPMSVRAAFYQIAGHELHHLNSIRQNYL